MRPILSVTDLTSRPEDAGSEDMALINASFAPLSLYLSGACTLVAVNFKNRIAVHQQRQGHRPELEVIFINQ